ncbi:MAG: crosslink repair DNA glycosylase YcaQ family protein, partial [Candidatus Phosphoribacter sp.]
ALLPTLDPTTMGWRVREFYLDPAHVPHLFDTNGNAGNTAWWDGRVVGAWVQDPDAVVQVVLCQGMEGVIGREGMAALDTEAARLTTWLDGVQITNVYSSRLMKGAPLP